MFLLWSGAELAQHLNADSFNFSSFYFPSASAMARLRAMPQPDWPLLFVVVWDIMAAGRQSISFPPSSLQQLLPSFFLFGNLTFPTAFFSVLLPLTSCFLFKLLFLSSGLHFSPLPGPGPNGPNATKWNEFSFNVEPLI